MFEVSEDDLQVDPKNTDKDLKKQITTKSTVRTGKLNGKALAAVSRDLDIKKTKTRELENKVSPMLEDTIDEPDSNISETSKIDNMNKRSTMVSPPQNNTSFKWQDPPFWLIVLLQVNVKALVILAVLQACVLFLVILSACSCILGIHRFERDRKAAR